MFQADRSLLQEQLERQIHIFTFYNKSFHVNLNNYKKYVLLQGSTLVHAFRPLQIRASIHLSYNQACSTTESLLCVLWVVSMKHSKVPDMHVRTYSYEV